MDDGLFHFRPVLPHIDIPEACRLIRLARAIQVIDIHPVTFVDNDGGGGAADRDFLRLAPSSPGSERGII